MKYDCITKFPFDSKPREIPAGSKDTEIDFCGERGALWVFGAARTYAHTQHVYPICAHRCVQRLLSERLRLSAQMGYTHAEAACAGGSVRELFVFFL